MKFKFYKNQLKIFIKFGKCLLFHTPVLRCISYQDTLASMLSTYTKSGNPHSKNSKEFSEYLRGNNFVGKNFRHQIFSSLAQTFVTFYRRKF